ncbi:MAG: hypothetical protein HQL13_08280 [Candidatus Omnitrophica bacterium]|nr:hypothetical protein [Candidatus Omnitrophota bacterium]
MLNNIGKTFTIFLILTLILLISSTCIGFYLYFQQQRVCKGVQADLETALAGNVKLQTQLKDVQAQLALVEDKNKEEDKKINSLLDEQDLNEGLRTALKKENVQLKEQITAIDASKQKIKASLDDAMQQLSRFKELLRSADAKDKDMQARITTLMEKNKNLETRLNEGNTKDATGQMQGDLGKIVVKQKPGTGIILSVDTDAEFVVFNLGRKEGVKAGSLLTVTRAGRYLGEIKATRVQDEMSAADLVTPLSSRAVNKNDTVVLKT